MSREKTPAQLPTNSNEWWNARVKGAKTDADRQLIEEERTVFAVKYPAPINTPKKK